MRRTAVTAALLATALATGARAGQKAPRPGVLSGPWPRAFFFRTAEGWAANPRIDYDRWEATFRRLMGIEGKVLDEEIVGRSRRTGEFFRRFKQAHPDQLVLLHFNGNARDPRFEAGEFFAGHWVYRPAVRVLADVPAEAGLSDIRVADARGFRVNTGRYRRSADDIALCALTDAGGPDWTRCEQVQLVSVDAARGAIRVRRGCYGTRPRAFAAGRAVAAAHATEGPWGRDNHLLWYYNYSRHCPRDPKGRSCSDVLVADLARRFAPGAALASFDGLEFDVLSHARGGKLDTDGDGRADNGFHEGINEYGAGVVEFLSALRRALPDRLILADGHSERNQRGFGILNGIESEGWPSLSDWKMDDFSGGLNRHLFWAANAHPPAFSYINHKYTEPGPTPGSRQRPDVPFSTHRLVFAAAMFTDSAVCYAFPPPRAPGELMGIWDELCMGRENRLGWLGRPCGPAVRLAMRGKDLLGGRALAGGADTPLAWVGEGVRMEPDGGGLRVSAAEKGAGQLRFRLAGVPTDGPDLFVSVTLSAEPMAGYPKEVARLVHVGIPPAEGVLVRQEPPQAAMCLRGQREGPIDPATGAAVQFRPRCEVGGEAHDAYFVHPPFRRSKGYTAWWRECRVPAGGRLELHTALAERAAGRSDGVVFRVEIADLAAGADAPAQRIFEHAQKQTRWTRHVVDVSKWAGRRVRLRFVSDCGPRDDTTTDHSLWGDVRLLGSGGPAQMTPPKRFMTWANGRPFTSGFYFSDVRSKSVDLEIVVEGGEPVRIHRISAHARPDAIYREYTGGLVLANPSPRPYVFDLARLLPGRRYRRLRAQPRQDTATNNGEAVGPTLRLGPKDALFLVRRPAGPAGAGPRE